MINFKLLLHYKCCLVPDETKCLCGQVSVKRSLLVFDDRVVPWPALFEAVFGFSLQTTGAGGKEYMKPVTWHHTLKQL